MPKAAEATARAEAKRAELEHDERIRSLEKCLRKEQETRFGIYQHELEEIEQEIGELRKILATAQR